jgi:hypothetical protein
MSLRRRAKAAREEVATPVDGQSPPVAGATSAEPAAKKKKGMAAAIDCESCGTSSTLLHKDRVVQFRLAPHMCAKPLHVYRRVPDVWLCLAMYVLQWAGGDIACASRLTLCSETDDRGQADMLFSNV